MGPLKPYPSMKGSGSPWLGDVPEHWGVSPIARIGKLFKGNGGSKEDEVAAGLPCVRYGDLYTRHEFFIQSTKACISSDRASAYMPIKYGDLIFAASGETLEDIGRSAVNLLDQPAYCGGDTLIFRPSSPINPRFLGYVADSPPVRHQKASMGRGFTVVHVYAAQVKHLTLPLPPLDEQAAIVRFLDHVDRKIRRFIQAKRRLIDLLNEQMSRKVDHILGYEGWTGFTTTGDETTVRLKYVARVQTGLTLGKKYGGVPLVTRPYLRVANVQSGYLNLSKITYVEVSLSEAQSCELQKGDVLLTEGGDIDKLGRGCLWDGEIDGCLHQNHLFAVRPDPSRLIPGFLALLMQSSHGRSYFERTAKKTTNLASTNSTILKAFPLSLPDVREQQKILAAAATQASEIMEAISRSQKEIDLIKEYRTRLIADVVTGKLDVRKSAEHLPLEMDQGDSEAEPIDLDETQEGDDEASELLSAVAYED